MQVRRADFIKFKDVNCKYVKVCESGNISMTAEFVLTTVCQIMKNIV